MRKLVKLLCLLFVFSVLLGSGFATAGGKEPMRGLKRSWGQGDKVAAGCSGSCYPGASDCYSACECSGALSCCTAGCGWCCSIEVQD